jgi:hypothetical protein
MKKLLTGIAVALFAGALAVPASANVDAVVFVNITKNVSIFENITKFKDVFVDVDFVEFADGAAEALALVNQENLENFADVDMSDGESGFAIDGLDASIDTGSVSNNVGITQVNQDVGVGANQANVVAVAVTDAEASVADAQSTVDQRNLDNEVLLTGPFILDDPERTAVISDSVNGNNGITQVNQNAGNWNNQANTAAVALGEADGAILALADAFLGQENTGNTVDAFTTIKTDVISGSVNGNTGITNVNQTTGNMNNQGVAISFSGIAALGLGGNPANIP